MSSPPHVSRRSLVWFGVGALMLPALLLAAGLAYPIDFDDHRPSSEAFHVEPSTPHAMEGEIAVDGETVLSVSSRASGDGTRYLRIVESDVERERYQPNVTEGTIYSRWTIDHDTAERQLEHLRDDPDREVLDVERRDGVIVVETVARHSDVDIADAAGGGGAVIATELRLAAYDRLSANTSEGSVVLEPTDGWYQGNRHYRLTDTRGHVRYDPDTDQLIEADVEWTLTPGSSSYLHYVLNRDRRHTKQVSYEFRQGPVTIDRPRWVERDR